MKNVLKDYNSAYKNAKSFIVFVVFSPSLHIAITITIPKAAIATEYYYFGSGLPASSGELYEAQVYLCQSALSNVLMKNNGIVVSDYSYDIYYI